MSWIRVCFSFWADHLAVMNNTWKNRKHIDTVLVVNCDAADSDTHTTVLGIDDDNAFCAVEMSIRSYLTDF